MKFPKLTISEGREKLTISCLAPEELAIIDNIETPIPCKLDLKMLKLAAELCDPEISKFAAGVTFRGGQMVATNHKVFFCGESGLPEEMSFIIHKDACVALGKFKAAVVAISKNNHTVKFIFDDDSSLCAHILTEQCPDTAFLFEGEWVDFKINDIEDFLRLDCDTIRVVDGSIIFTTETTEGELTGVVEGNVSFKAKKKHFDYLLKGDLSFEGSRIQSVGDNWAFVCTTMST